MSTPRINAAFALLQDEVSNCEKALFKLIEMKEKMPEQPMEMPKLPEQPMATPKMPEKPMNTPMETSKINARLQQTPIAIIGMASLLPESKNLQEYWEKILQKVDCITDVPASRWDVDAYYDPDPRAPDKTYCKRGGFIPDIDFNPMEFGLPPNNVEVTDVSQLLSLVVAKDAMEDAGYGESRKFNREKAGVILGTAMAKQLATPLTARLQYPVWEKVLKSSGLSDEDTQKIVEKIKKAYIQWDENAFPGLLANIISGRIANRLDFGGTNCVVDAACASSLSALSMAISELVEHRADLMITGGVDTDNTAVAYLCFSKTPAVSKGDKVRPFDADSDGMMLGEGLGMIVIKRLEDAVRDNDRIYAVIKGVGTSSDGRYKSIYAPRPEGQIRALRRAYEDAGFSPTSVTLVEAHGTGTMIGDPTEFSALKEFFSENNPRSQHIAIGSVKSQIGHTKAAAGAASLIKIALALHHKILPPTINVTKPHPKLQIETSPFYLNTETRPWIRSEGEAPRRAGVSSFGFGGTNFHIVLEEYEGEHQKAYRVHKTAQSVLLSAPTPAELLAQCEEMLQKLQSDEKEQHYKELIEACQSLEIPVTNARVGFVADSLTQAFNLLKTSIDGIKNRIEADAWQHPQGIHYRKTGMALEGKVVALFSGQGSQYPEMGRELAINFPSLRQVYGYMDSLFLQDKLKPVSEAVFPQPVFDPAQKDAQVQMLQRTEYAQPAIGALSVGLYKILQQAGFKPDFVAGHSFGELTALWAAEALSDEDYFSLVKARGQAMATPDDPSVDVGTMLAVTGNALKVEEVIKQFPQVNIANFNSNKQIVLAGVKSELVKVQQVLNAQGESTVWLPVSAAFHTPLVGHAQKPFAKAVDAITFQKAKIPVFTNVTGNCYPVQPELMSKVLKEHLINPVLFKREIENIYAQGGYCFIEFGPRSVLTHLVKEILSDRPHVAVALNASRQKDSDRQLREATVQLRVAGLPLKNLDPFQLEQKIPTVPKNQLLNIRLGASNHVSEKTRKAFEDALQDGHQVKLTAAPVEPKQPSNGKVGMGTNGNGITGNSHIDAPHHSVSPSPRLLPQVNTAEPESLPVTQPILSASGSNTADTAQAKPTQAKPTPVPTQLTPEPKMQLNPEMPLHYHQRILESLEYTLAQFNQQQGGLLQVHEQSLNHQLEYIKTFFQLTQQQNFLFGNRKSAPQQEATNFVVQESSERSMMKFHDHQAETLRVHEQFLSHQMEHLTNLFQFMQQQYSSVLMKDNSTVNGNFTLKGNSTQTKGNSTQTNGNSTHTNGNSTQTNGGSTQTNGSSSYERLMSTQLAATIASTQHNGNGNGNGNGHTELVTAKDTVAPELDSSSLLRTVPAVIASELLINPEKPSSNVSKFALESQAVYTEPMLAVTEVINLESLKSNGAKIVQESEAVNVEPESTAMVATKPSTAIDFSTLGSTLLAIVSEKTGYPAEMLELEMDMEADLGIDSIKRVEILGGLQELYPDLPKPENLEELAALRTLGQIAEYMQNMGQGSPQAQPELIKLSSTVDVQQPAAVTMPEFVSSNGVKAVQETLTAVAEPEVTVTVASPSPVVEPEVTVTVASPSPVASDFANLGSTLLAIVSEKTGYPAEMLELEMDMEADLGIDSIKRVEILGALQELYPNLPKPAAENLEELAALRTLGQIAEYMEKQGTESPEKKTPSAELVSNPA